MSSDTEFIYYEDNKLFFTEDIRDNLALPFRNGLVLSYKKALLIYLLGVQLPTNIFYWYSYFFWGYLPIPAVKMIAHELFYTFLHGFTVFLVIFLAKGIVFELNGILDVKNAQRGEARVSLRTVITDEKEYNRFRRKILKDFYLKGRFDLILVILTVILYVTIELDSAYTRYFIYHQSIEYAVFGVYPYPYPMPIYIFVVYKIAIITWIYLISNFFIALVRIVNLLRNISNLSRYIQDKIITRTLSGFLKILEKNNIEETTNIKRITKYSSLWSVSNTFAKIFEKVSFNIMFDVFVVVMSIYAEQLFNTEIPTTFLTFYVYGIVGIFAVVSILILIVPLFNFKRLFSLYRAYLIGVIQDIYEKKMLHYIAVKENSAVKEKIANELSVLQEVIEYLGALNDWPIRAPQFIKISLVTLASAVIPYLFDALIKLGK